MCYIYLFGGSNWWLVGGCWRILEENSFDSIIGISYLGIWDIRKVLMVGVIIMSSSLWGEVIGCRF